MRKLFGLMATLAMAVVLVPACGGELEPEELAEQSTNDVVSDDEAVDAREPEEPSEVDPYAAPMLVEDDGVPYEEVASMDEDQSSVSPRSHCKTTWQRSGAGCPNGSAWYDKELSSTRTGCCGTWSGKYTKEREHYRCYVDCPAYEGRPCFNWWKETCDDICGTYLGCW